MKGNPKVLQHLNEALKAELTAINQYFLHASMCQNWGYLRMAKKQREESIGEMKHAEQVMERILFLEGMPRMEEMGKLTIGKDVPQQIKNDLALERSAVLAYNKAIETSRKAGDNATADFLQDILKDEEMHVDLLEKQLSLIDQLGLTQYLAQQIGEPE